MEVLLGAAALGVAGYFMGKNNETAQNATARQNYVMNQTNNNNMVEKALLNQQTNMEEPNYTNMANAAEQEQVTKFFNESQNPISTNQIPYGMNQNLRNNAGENTNNFIDNIESFQGGGGGGGNGGNGKKVYSELTGRTMNSGDFTHNNMVPFFGSKVTQNTETFQNQAKLDFHTGRDMYYHPKKEKKPLFGPTPDLGYVCGAPAPENRELERYVSSDKRTNELPFEKIQVGPGLNKGFTSAATGGFHDFDQRDYAVPKNVDELRTVNNPKLQYKGRVSSGKSNIDNRGMEGEVAKYKVDTFYINTPERYLTTTGAYVKDTQRPMVLVKDTNRQCTSANEYTGIAGATTNKQTKLRAKIKQSTRQNYFTDGVRNATGKDNWVDMDMGDYGKKALFLPAQEREVTGLRTHVSNATSIVKAIVAPLVDVMKTTKKENTIGNPNLVGNFKTNISKMKVYDPNDVAKTTIKETLIDNEHTGYYTRGVSQKPTIHDPNDVARTTMKETLIHDEHTANFNRSVVQDGQGYLTNEKEAPNTNRQFTSEYEYEGIANGNAVPGGNGTGYLTNEKEAPNTNRQFTSDYEYVGGAASKDSAQTSYCNMYAANLNETREGTLVGRDPTPSNVSLGTGGDRINMETKKLEGDRVNSRNMSKTRVFNSIPQKNECQFTNSKDQLNNDEIYNRNNPEILDAFKKNPYTKSLNSYGYS
jgi:hypothetical protein